MKTPRPISAIGRKRRTLGWTLFILGLLVAGVWVASGYWRLYWTDSDAWLGAFRGRFIMGDSKFGRAYKRGWHWSVAQFDANYADRYSWRTEPPPPSSADPLVSGWDLCVSSYSVQNFVSGEQYRIFELVLWPIPLLLWTPAALLLRSGIVARRRALGNKCKKCGYDLAGLAADAPCPECGKGAVTT